MHAGAILAHFDVAQITIYVFWGFFFSLIYYLRREDHREGYPLVADYEGQAVMDYPPLPAPKTFLMGHGHDVLAPRPEAPEVVAASRALPWVGAPFEPHGDPMIDGVGPAAYANRQDVPDLAYDDGMPKIIPLRVAPEFYLAEEDADPRGYTVYGANGEAAGTVVDIWVDRSEYIVRYLEVETLPSLGGRRALMPMSFASIKSKTASIKVYALLPKHFATVPALRKPDQVTLLEEDKICAYYAGGLMYATPDRQGPLL